MLGLGREKNFVGLDIGSYAVKAVELKSKRKGTEDLYEVRKIGYELLPHDAIVEGTIIDSQTIMIHYYEKTHYWWHSEIQRYKFKLNRYTLVTECDRCMDFVRNDEFGCS